MKLSKQLASCSFFISLAVLCGCSPDSGTNSSNSTSATTSTASPPAANMATQTPPVKKVGVSERHKPSAATITKATDPKPPANAKKGKTIGKGRVAVQRKRDSSVWAEEIDIDGDGSVEKADFLHDAADKVTFIYAEKAFPCGGGGVGNGGVLTAVWGAGNKAGNPAGSGFWAAELDAGECGAATAALWGCKFDASGAATECGVADVTEEGIAITDREKSATPTPAARATVPAAKTPAKAPANANGAVR